MSHATEDLPRVRDVRNYLESRDAAPLLFHLMALKKPNEFWPLIEREIAERPFFLLCESISASKSSWVQKEKRAAKLAAKAAPKRIGTIRVDGRVLDYSFLDEFIASTRIFPSYAHYDQALVQPFLSELAARGFELFDQLTDLTAGQDINPQISDALRVAAKRGWVLIFLTRASLRSRWVQFELEKSRELGASTVPILLEPRDRLDLPLDLDRISFFDATIEQDSAPKRLADQLLLRSRSLE